MFDKNINIQTSMSSTFLESYSRKIFTSLDNDFDDNWDEFRFGGPDSVTTQRGNGVSFPHGLLNAMGLTTTGAAKQKVGTCKEEIAKAIAFIAPHISNLEWLYAHLADEESRQTLVEVVAYRALGHRKIKLPTNTPDYWAIRERAFNLPREGEEIDVGFLGWKLRKVSLESFGYPIKIFANKGANVTTFVHQQYRCETPYGHIECQAGDYIIDAGGCYGDTALYLSHLAGPNGRVASFEFLPQNLSVLRKNLDLNPNLARTIRVYENPVWAESGNELFVSGSGPGTKVTENKVTQDATSVSTLKIDDVVGAADFPKVDFIKMDIEGAEQQALRGSEESIRRFKPKLAITVYHSLEDFWEIPKWIAQLGLGYEFYLRHFTIHQEETVLFGVAK
jgi:FkbM family methyltransferase